VVVPLAAACAAGLALRRRWPEFWVLVAGTTIVLITAADLKAAVDRPRPGAGLTGASGSAFPSGHAAHSAFYVWAAVTITVRLRPGMARATAVVVAGIVLALLIGLSRVYLHVHYLSDATAGWALGAASYALCAAIALVATTVRQNGRDAARQPRT
jgi:undecaprenyl-diphosphatase